MNVTRKGAILASVVLILVSGAIQPPNLHADAMLVLTENSSTSLTVTLDGTGLFVIQGVGDNWALGLPPGDFLTSPTALYWHEPDTTLSVNAFIPSLEVPSAVSVTSEFHIPPGVPINGNGVQVTLTNGINIGGTVQDLIVQFNDNSDVPEPSTLSYIIVAALISAIGFRRKLRSLLRRGGTKRPCQRQFRCRTYVSRAPSLRHD
jgi:hypothetical protein